MVSSHDLGVGGKFVEKSVAPRYKLAGDIKGYFVRVVRFDTGEQDDAHGKGRLFDFFDDLLFIAGQIILLLFRLFSARPDAETFFCHLECLCGVEVTYEEQCHVGGDIVFVVEHLHLAGLWVFQVAAIADDVATVWGVRRMLPCTWCG